MKICFISGSRADYGLLSQLMLLVKNEKSFKYQLILTGSHLSKKHGYTYKEVLKDGFKINHLVDLNINKDQPTDICNYTSLAIKKISSKLEQLKPNLLVILGDRYEIFAACTAAFIHQIPICHLHGGELTAGSIDDSFRHSITKMSNIHLVSNIKYAKRVQQLGENPKNIFTVGGFGVDMIQKIKILKKEELEKKLKFNFLKKNLLVTYHPETAGNTNPKKDFNEILISLRQFKDIKFIFTKSNADTNGLIINKMINDFVKRNNSNSVAFKSMGQINYLSTLKYVDGVIGNSSSGLLEAPFFKKITINVGNRQKYRLKSKSVIDTSPDRGQISKNIKKIYLSKFENSLKNLHNPYGKGGASKKSFSILKKIKNKKIILDKKFVDQI